MKLGRRRWVVAAVIAPAVLIASGASPAGSPPQESSSQHGGIMEIRYLGFDQKQNSRVYRFDVRAAGHPAKEVSITADMAVFRDCGVGIQEGPALSGNK